MEQHWLWPFKGGTRKERRGGIGYLLLLLLLWGSLYLLAWALAPIS